MGINMPESAVTADRSDSESVVPRARDADLALLTAARRRFARNGYGSTTVREIARDAGVNVALINRYFESKEGLFEACLERAAAQVDRTTALTIEQVVESVVENMASSVADREPYQLLLLIRSSGDERADRIRLDTIQSFAERIASVVGWTENDPGSADILLRAQLAVSMALGIALLRVTGGGISPLSEASAADLARPLRDAFATLLVPSN